MRDDVLEPDGTFVPQAIKEEGDGVGDRDPVDEELLGGVDGHPRQRVLEGRDEVRHRQLGDDELLSRDLLTEEIANEDVPPQRLRGRPHLSDVVGRFDERLADRVHPLRERELEAKRQKAEEERTARQREENLRRMMGQVGATGTPDSTGTAARDAGPSASYAGRIKARIKPNIVLTDNVDGNPSAEVEVRCAADGTIVGWIVTEDA